MKKPKHTSTEHEEQVVVIAWANDVASSHPELGLLFKIANDGNRRINYAMKMKAEGLKSGVPDLFLPVARQGYHGLFIEMKRRGATPSRDGKLSKTQEEWFVSLKAQGYRVEKCIGADEAIAVLLDYLTKKVWSIRTI